ncbi:MAG: hypothetical protein JKX97_00850 [Candidatus Lindowbacteria bacterium]|nr:hypothetical protein [Candidatus Lindowbacteria bacterium]
MARRCKTKRKSRLKKKNTSADFILYAFLGCTFLAFCIVGSAIYLYQSNSAFEVAELAGGAEIQSAPQISSVGDVAFQNAVAKKDWATAVVRMEELVKANPGNSDYRKALGMVLSNHGLVISRDNPGDLKLLATAAAKLKRAVSFLQGEPDRLKKTWEVYASVGANEYRAGQKRKGKSRIEEANRRQANDDYISYSLGSIFMNEGAYAKAKPLLEIAARSSDVSIQQKSKDLLAHIGSDVYQEQFFSSASSNGFVVRFQGPSRPDLASTVTNQLTSLRSTVRAVVGSVPDNDIEIILYTSDRYKQERGLPDWAGGSFDGRIRVGIGDISGRNLRQTLGHEYAHAAVYHKVGNRAPVWLNEGIAQCVELGRNPSRRQLQEEIGGRAPLLSSLNGGFLNMGREQALASCATSWGAVSYMLVRRGSGSVPNVLSELAKGSDINAALKKATGLTVDELGSAVLTDLGY